MKKIQNLLTLALVIILSLAFFSGCGAKKEAGLYEGDKLVKTWDELLKEVGYTDFDGKEIVFKDSETHSNNNGILHSETITYTSYFESVGEKSKKYDLVLPDGITSIGDGAFSFCLRIKSIELPDGVTSIGDSAFVSCGILKNVNIPDSVKTIGDNAFFWCYDLESIKIPNSVKVIGDSAFNDCHKLESVKLSNSITSIENFTFCCCKKLTDIKIPDGVKIIGQSAFEECEQLTEVVLPDSVTSIGADAFARCKNLISITIPDSVTNIYYTESFNAFEDCDKLTIYGSKGSYAELFANENGIAFVEK